MRSFVAPKPDRGTSITSTGARSERDDALERFEAAWQQGPPPALVAFLPPAPADISPAADPACTKLFHELVKIDLEYRWRRSDRDVAPEDGALPRHPRLEDYLALLPGFGTAQDLPSDLVGEEYRVRQRWGDRPAHAEFAARFPNLAPQLAAELARIDAELENERFSEDPQGRISPRGAAPASPPKSTSSLRCPHCRHSIDVPAELPSRDLACPACGGAFQVESLAAVPGRRAPPPFARVGRYELGELLGAGAFGSVWRARDTELKRDVAVKLPRSGQVLGPADEERFLREARSAARLQHPGIVTVHDVGRDHDTLYLVSELVQGVSLAEWLKHRRLSFRESAQLVADVADALDFAHQRGVVHRDVKPSNIMLENTKEQSQIAQMNAEMNLRESAFGSFVPRLMDFGLALRNAGEITMTLDGQVLGTPAYISPEQLRNPHAVDGRSDVYSLGVILYELLTGELPFRGMTQMLLDQVVSEEPRPPRKLNDRIARDLETICLKCLVKEPAGRYPTAAALAADLRRWLAGRPIAARPLGWTRRSWLWIRRHPVPVIATGMLSISLAAVLGVATSLVVLSLMVVAVGALLVAVYNAKATGELTAAAEFAALGQQKTAAALQCALEHCVQARAERGRALAVESQASRRFSLLRGLAKAWIYELPAVIHQEAGPTTTRSLMVKAALAYLDGLAKEAGDDPILLRETAAAYARVAELQEGFSAGQPADLAGALATQRKSLEIFTALARQHPANAQAQRDCAASAAKVREAERALQQVVHVI